MKTISTQYKNVFGAFYGFCKDKGYISADYLESAVNPERPTRKELEEAKQVQMGKAEVVEAYLVSYGFEFIYSEDTYQVLYKGVSKYKSSFSCSNKDTLKWMAIHDACKVLSIVSTKERESYLEANRREKALQKKTEQAITN